MDKMDIKKVFEIGRSIAIVLPKDFCIKHNIKAKTRILLTEFDNKIMLETLTPETMEKLIQLGFLSEIPKEVKQ